MGMKIKAEIISIGTEFLAGHVIERNSAILADELTRRGCAVQWISIVGDVRKDIEAALRHAASRATVIVTTGGLGMSRDDVTRRAVGHAVGRRLVLNEKVLKELERWFPTSQPPISQAYARGALIPARAHILLNPKGATQGFALQWDKRYLICLPGMTQEMHPMYLQSVLPYLAPLLKRLPAIRISILHTTGFTNAEIQKRLGELLGVRGAVKIELIDRFPGVDILVKGTGRSEREVMEILEPLLDKIRERFKTMIYGEDKDTLEAVVGRVLSKRQLKIAIAESCTGGLIGHRITNVSGSSAYLNRVEVCYSNLSKIEVLGVPPRLLEEHGAVSAPVAAAMAKGVRERSRVALGLAVTGIAGPTGGTLKKPVGLVVFALATPKGVRTVSSQFSGGREAIKMQASEKALDLVRQYLLENP